MLVGVPLITPVLLLRTNPVGNDPAVMTQVNGGVPVAVRVSEYGVLTPTEGNGHVVVIVGTVPAPVPAWKLLLLTIREETLTGSKSLR